jgi:hypothetical protein
MYLDYTQLCLGIVLVVVVVVVVMVGRRLLD